MQTALKLNEMDLLGILSILLLFLVIISGLAMFDDYSTKEEIKGAKIMFTIAIVLSIVYFCILFYFKS